MRMRWKTAIECKACCGPHSISWFGIAPPEIGRTYAYRCPSRLTLQLIDASALAWEVAEGYAGRAIVVGAYEPRPEAELLELDQSQPY
jgi:hypothetical protein